MQDTKPLIVILAGLLLICMLGVFGLLGGYWLTQNFNKPANWVMLTPLTNPPALVNASVAYDRAAGKAVLFGGITEEKWSNETWTWDGKDWNLLELSNQPGPRENAMMAYDEDRQRIVLFGGASGNSLYDDTWEWDGAAWSMAAPDHRPAARFGGAMAYDPAKRRVLLYGGVNQETNTFYKDAWEWDGADWAEVTCCNTPEMSSHAMITFARTHEVLSISSVEWVETWAWNGSGWRDIGKNPSPARASARAAYDENRGWAVYFGGTLDRKEMDDTWVFDGKTWRDLQPRDRPTPRFGHIMFYDPTRKSIILYGGGRNGAFLGDTWELNLSRVR